MSSLNQVNIIGRLGQDPEVRFMQNGNAVANLSVATSETWKDKQTGEKKEATEWHRITIYGKLAEIAGQYLKKGSLAFFSGSLKTRKWTDNSGVERYTTEIHAQEMKMLGGRDGGSQPQQSGPQSGQAGQSQASRSQGNQPPMDFDDDIPF